MVGEPELEFSVLGSGSKGNSVLVRGGGTTLLIDAGFSLKSTRARLSSLGLEDLSVDGILITHEHLDHIQHVRPLSRAWDAPIFVNDGTLGAWPERLNHPDLPFERFETGATWKLGSLTIETRAKAHDAKEAVGVVVSHGDRRFGCFTDLGSVDEGLPELLASCDALHFEANHDPRMLMQGKYPPSLQRRVGGRFGHLSNEDAARCIGRLESDRLGCIVLGHLSGQNNHPSLVRDAFVRFGGKDPGYPRFLSRQDRPQGLFSIEANRVVRVASPEPAPAVSDPAAP